MKEFEEGIKRGTKGGKIALFLGILVVVLGVLAAYLGTTFYSRRMDDFNAALELTGKERAAALRKVLSESWWSDVRTEAAYELGELRDKEAVPLLIEAVKASDTFLKRTAAEALAKIGDTRQEVLDAIYEQVLEAEGTEQFELAWSLGRLEDKRALPPLLDAYLRGDHKEFEDFDEGIIAELGGLPELKKLLTHKDPAVRMFAAQYIGPIGGKEAVDALIPVLNDPKPQVVIAAAASLCQCDDPRVQPKIIELIKNRPQLMPQLVAAMNIYVGAPGLGALLKATDDLKIHNEVMVHLQNLRDPRGADILTEYIENSPSDPQKRTFQGVDLRKVAIWALSDLGDQRAVPYLIARLSEDDVDKVREVIDVIGKLKDPRAVEPLTTLMASNPFYRAPVIMALARYRDPSLAPLIAPHLKSEDSQTAALALGMTGNTKYTKDLIEMSKKPKEEEKEIWKIEQVLMERTKAMQGLGFMGDISAADHLKTILEDTTDTHVMDILKFRTTAADALGAIATPDILKQAALNAVNEEMDMNTRILYLRVLWQRPLPEAAEIIIKILESGKGEDELFWNTAIALGEIAAVKIAPRLTKLLKNKKIAPMAALAIIMGGEKEGVLKVAKLMKANKEFADIVRYRYEKHPLYLTKRMFEDKRIYRRLELAQILRDSEEKIDWPWEFLINRLKRGWEGPNGLYSLEVRALLGKALHDKDPWIIEKAAAALAGMGNRGILLAAAAEKIPEAKIVRRILRKMRASLSP